VVFDKIINWQEELGNHCSILTELQEYLFLLSLQLHSFHLDLVRWQILTIPVKPLSCLCLWESVTEYIKGKRTLKFGVRSNVGIPLIVKIPVDWGSKNLNDPNFVTLSVSQDND
jgi:hypothetical protein